MKNDNIKKGQVLLGIGLFLLVLSFILERTKIWLYISLVGLIIVFIGAYYLGKNDKYHKFILKENVKIISWKDVIKNYFGRGALGGLGFSLISKYSMVETLLTMLFFELGILIFYYIYHKLKKRLKKWRKDK